MYGKLIEDLGTREHGKYNYKKRFYLMECLQCEKHFEQSADVAKRSKTGLCKSCAGKASQSNKSTKAAAQFSVKASSVHCNKYTYENTVYVTNKANVLITCPIHGDFEQTPTNHLEGAGCPSCAKSGFNPLRPALLYYFKIKGVYKIGITNNTIEARYNNTDRAFISELQTWDYQVGADAYNAEQTIKRLYREYRYTGSTPFTDGTSTTECFSIDVFGQS